MTNFNWIIMLHILNHNTSSHEHKPETPTLEFLNISQSRRSFHYENDYQASPEVTVVKDDIKHAQWLFYTRKFTFT
jgi:hypothetical protein